MDRVELHFHLLPGVDDGPEDLETALELARQAVDDGTRLVTCTPHVRDAELDEIPDRVHELAGALREARVALEIRTGAELAWDDVEGLDDAALDAIAQGPPGARWLLLEAPLPGTGDLADFLAAAGDLRERGFGLLVGHPERSPELSAAPQAIAALLRAGDRLQVNGSSLTGRHGERARAVAIDLVRSGRASVIASDAHRPRRGAVLRAAVAVLVEHGVAARDAERLVSANPRALLERGVRQSLLAA